jgi:hypothetical protein
MSVIAILRQSVTSSARNVASRLADARRRARQLATENVGGQRESQFTTSARGASTPHRDGVSGRADAQASDR